MSSGQPSNSHDNVVGNRHVAAMPNRARHARHHAIVEADGTITRDTAGDFGSRDIAFPMPNVRSVDAPARAGCREEVGERVAAILSHRLHFGILFGDQQAVTVRSWGNAPQTGATAGVINAATRLSRSWEDAWCLDL